MSGTERPMTAAIKDKGGDMIDNFALGLSHVLMLLTAILLLRRPDLDDERSPKAKDRPPRA